MTNVEVVKELLATVGRNDVKGALALCSPDLEFLDVLAPMEDTVRNVRGEQGLRDWFQGLHRRGKRVAAEPLELHEVPGGRVFGTVRMVQEKPGDSFSLTIYVIWRLEDRRVTTICSFFDRALAVKAAELEQTGPPPRRWVEGVVTSKLVDRLTVRLTSAEYDGSEFSVGDVDVWKEIEVGALGMAETDGGQLLSWRRLERTSG